MSRRYKINERRIGIIILMVIAAITVFSFIVMALWNNVLAVTLHVSTINFWQALGILALSKILFGGFRGGWGGHRGYRYGYWRKEMTEKWKSMTPEEREKFKQEWQSRCGHWRRSVPTEQTEEKTVQ